MSGLSWIKTYEDAYYAYFSFPNGVTTENYLFSNILVYGETGAYCTYVGIENGKLCIAARSKPTQGGLVVRLFYNGLI